MKAATTSNKVKPNTNPLSAVPAAAEDDNPINRAVDEMNNETGSGTHANVGAGAGDEGGDEGDGEGLVETDTVTNTNTRPLTKVEKAEKVKPLFDRYREIDKKMTAARAVIAENAQEQSDLAGQIGAILGKGTKFKYDGAETMVVSRKKKGTNEVGHYFRSHEKEEDLFDTDE